MTPEAAFYSFMSSFGIPAYTSASVPHDATFPYLTYDLSIGEFGGTDASIAVNVWYRTESEAAPNAKVREMYERIGLGGVTLPCDGGLLWVKRGSPWAQSLVVDGEDEMVKRRYVNLQVDFSVL